MASSQQSYRKGPWSAGEDVQLLQHIQLYGLHNWKQIASLVNTRTPKQCRERYHQNLKPSLNRSKITKEEGEKIEQLVRKIGKRWTKIAQRLQGRSDNAVKNWWNGEMKKRERCRRLRSQSYSQDEINTTVITTQDISRHPEDNMNRVATPQFATQSSPVPRNLIFDISPKHHRYSPLSSLGYAGSSRGEASAFSASPRMRPPTISNENTPPLLPSAYSVQNYRRFREPTYTPSNRLSHSLRLHVASIQHNSPIDSGHPKYPYQRDTRMNLASILG